LAYQALDKGGNQACALNAANEISVAAFLQDQIGFLDIQELNEKVMNQVDFVAKPALEDYIETDKKARILAQSFIKK
jgi:1-deoxy-D-xylulose-5-phosphate reductoisomerase